MKQQVIKSNWTGALGGLLALIHYHKDGRGNRGARSALKSSNQAINWQIRMSLLVVLSDRRKTPSFVCSLQ
jgi:hypothetical protein